ncbi:DUF983 domain-containing protein [Marivirga sp. S37H4]|uniref:DUF983 domain-containing protein n=1 Tax=Marivirga aurantiaca TaxID=2802615 RepID=A0A934X086_9BACT|nr:DUF983 domain-containing protein [Marivirga aurantiaca]MBK6266269.1 DUF983 domain-containing protein [Marivirga aurantiaca]
MFNKGNKLYSIFKFKCPRCHEGQLFETPAYNLKKFQKMPERCHHCGLRYMAEPSFFDGAMYISYAMQVALIITVFVALNILGVAELWLILTLCIFLSVLLIPITFRLSKSAYINIFIKYDPDKKSEY